MDKNIGILGTGALAQKRYNSLLEINKNFNIFIGSSSNKRAIEFSKGKKIYSNGSYDEIISNKKISKIIICNETYKHYDLIKKCLNNNKHVLCEKPLTMKKEETKKIKNISYKKKLVLTCGLNHRFYPAIKDIKQLLKNKNFGKLLHINSKYCYSGREKKVYRKEWRSNKKKTPGGIIIEHGIHILDLIFHLFGKPKNVNYMLTNNFYKLKNLEETFAIGVILKNNNSIANVFSSCTNWKNIFELNITFENGYLDIINPNPSYGKSILKIGYRNHYKPFEFLIREYSNKDTSFQNEIKQFLWLIKQKKYKKTNIDDVIKLQNICEEIYKSNKKLHL